MEFREIWIGDCGIQIGGLRDRVLRGRDIRGSRECVIFFNLLQKKDVREILPSLHSYS